MLSHAKLSGAATGQPSARAQEHDRSRAHLEVSRLGEPPEWSAPLYQGAPRWNAELGG